MSYLIKFSNEIPLIAPLSDVLLKPRWEKPFGIDNGFVAIRNFVDPIKKWFRIDKEFNFEAFAAVICCVGDLHDRFARGHEFIIDIEFQILTSGKGNILDLARCIRLLGRKCLDRKST